MGLAMQKSPKDDEGEKGISMSLWMLYNKLSNGAEGVLCKL